MNLILVVAVVLGSCSRSDRMQSLSGSSDSTQCIKGRQEANADIRKNVLARYYFGLPTDKFQMYLRILKDEYGIEVKGGGDLVDDFGTCYNEIMDEQVKKKLGLNFFSNVQAKIDSLYSAGKGDHEVFYPGGVQALETFLACNVKIPGTKREKQKVYVDLQIDTIGKVQSVIVKKGIDKQSDSEAIQVAKLLIWSPAIENQKPVASRQTIAVPFDPELKQRVKCN